jgi:succinyl-diaminopimelate desuccinylase
MGDVLQAIDDAVASLAPEMLQFACDLIAIPTVNPPGDNYHACSELISAQLRKFGFEVRRVVADAHQDHTARYPRHNVIATRAGLAPRPLLHFNGHIDVVPPGSGWTRDPFAATVENGKLYGRGSSDMKCGLAAAVFATEALRVANVPLLGSLQVSATVDEETGGFAGVAYLAQLGLLTSRTIDYVIIPEPFGASRICIGHRGLYWFRIISRGKIAHGSMPHLGVNAIENMAVLLEEIRDTVAPEIAAKITAMPVVPMKSRCGTFNINSIQGGQSFEALQSPCVADRCEVICERRWVPEESLEEVKSQITAAIERVSRSKPGSNFELEDYGNTVHPTSTPCDTDLVTTLKQSIYDIKNGAAELVASPGTYDHKHFTHIGNIVECVAYGPGELEQAHQPDEWCSVEAMLQTSKIMALTAARLLGKH